MGGVKSIERRGEARGGIGSCGVALRGVGVRKAALRCGVAWGNIGGVGGREAKLGGVRRCREAMGGIGRSGKA